jgi:hypothetical protein
LQALNAALLQKIVEAGDVTAHDFTQPETQVTNLPGEFLADGNLLSCRGEICILQLANDVRKLC